jgi:hypothetical protein
MNEQKHDKEIPASAGKGFKNLIGLICHYEE